MKFTNKIGLAKISSIRALVLQTTAVALLAPMSVSAGVVVVVGAKSPAAKLGSEQAAQLYLGKAATLPGAGDVQLVDQSEGSAIRDTFYSKVVGKTPTQVKAIWSRLAFSGTARPPKEVASAADVKRAVSADPNAVGYIDSSEVDASVKVVLSVD